MFLFPSNTQQKKCKKNSKNYFYPWHFIFSSVFVWLISLGRNFQGIASFGWLKSAPVIFGLISFKTINIREKKIQFFFKKNFCHVYFALLLRLEQKYQVILAQLVVFISSVSHMAFSYFWGRYFWRVSPTFRRVCL